MIRHICILGLKDREGNYYCYHSHNEKSDTYVQLHKEAFVPVEKIFLFPFNTFKGSSYFNKERFEWTLLKVRNNVNREVSDNILHVSQKRYQYRKQEIMLMEEYDHPFLYANYILGKLHREGQVDTYREITRRLISEQVKHGFKSEKDLNAYCEIHERNTLHFSHTSPYLLTRYNFEHFYEFYRRIPTPINSNLLLGHD